MLLKNTSASQQRAHHNARTRPARARITASAHQARVGQPHPRELGRPRGRAAAREQVLLYPVFRKKGVS